MSPFLKFTHLLIVVWALAASPDAGAQIPGIPSSKTPAAPEAETPGQTKTRLQTWLKEARAALARFEEPNAETQLPEGIQPPALAERRRDLDQTVRTLNRSLSLLEDIPNAEAAVKEAEAARSQWSGFAEKPPYSILKLDDLVNQRDATREKHATFQSSLSIFSKSLDGIDKETKATEEATRQALDLAGKEPENEAAKWRLEAVRAKARLLSARALFVRANIELLTHQAAASTAQLALIERQVSSVQKSARITDADLATVRKAADDRRAGLRKEILDIRQRLKDASTGRSRAKTAFDELTAQNAGNPSSPELGLAAARLTAAEARVETLQFISDNLEAFESLEGFIPIAYENRKTLIDSKIAADRAAALEGLHTLLDRLNAWEIVSANELAAANADLAKQESNAALIPADDPRLPALADQRKALWEKQAFLQRVAQTVIAHRKNITRWVQAFETQAKGDRWYSDISDSGESLWNLVRRIWSFEVLRSQNVREVAGVPITDTRTVSLGVVLTALVLFIIAYIVSARISRRVQNLIVGRGHLAEAQANTIRNWMMIVVGIALALITLNFLSIPLTVFAFFGGALAIGLGFGTQTLIKNFISGIIVLFERKIRVGDIVDIGGLSGSVSEINTRSSVLKGADGRETLVPNSVFLENSITNLTLSNRTSRRAVNIGVTYGTSPQQVMTILCECAVRHGLVLKDPQPLVIFLDFADNALLFRIYFWTAFDGKTNPELVESDIRIMILKRFEESGISFPYPQRDLHLMADRPLQIEVLPQSEEEAPAPRKPMP